MAKPAVPRHPPSACVWRFCYERLQDLRGADVRERELGQILGFEHARAVRWKEGNMYLDRAELLLTLSEELAVPPGLLVRLAAGRLSVKDAQAELQRRPRGKAVAEAEVLYVSSEGKPAAFEAALRGHAGFTGWAASDAAVGLLTAGEHRPTLAFVEAAVAGGQVFSVVRALSRSKDAADRLCRVVVGYAASEDGEADRRIEAALGMAGAAACHPFPFTAQVLDDELRRLAQRLAPRRD